MGFFNGGLLIVMLPSGELTVCNGKSPFLMGKSTISIAIFHCYVSSPVILMVILRDCHGYFLGHDGIDWDSGSKVGGAVKLYTSVYRYT